MRGTVKWFSEEKGYGFITPTEGGKDVFVHTSALRAARISNLQEGQHVEFEMQSGPKGLQASDVSLA
jgi:CspA family cold shock protein